MSRFGILSVVAHKLRIQYPGAVYHGMSRGDRRDPIFKEERDYELFLRTLEEACQKALWQVQALAARRKGDAAKVKLAASVRAETTLPLAWIAERLRMGSRGYLTWLLHRQGKAT